MKLIIIYLVFSLTLIVSGCKSLKKQDYQGAKTTVHFMIPDTCEFYFFSGIADYRKEKVVLPEMQKLDSILSSLDEACYQSFENVRSLNYNSDSMDVVYGKSFLDTSLSIQSALKGYRLIFVNDTLKNTRLLHGNQYESALWQAGNKRKEP